jgi:hypothetical protein
VDHEYDEYQVGDKLLFLEQPLRAAVEVLEKSYTEEGGSRFVVFKIRFTRIYRHSSADEKREAGYECSVSRNLGFTGWVHGLWRFLPLNEAREQAILEHEEKSRLARETKG